MTDLVTGEAVVLELRLAKLASRALALAIDLAVQLGLFLFGILVLTGLVGFVDAALASAVGLLFYVLVIVGYPVAFETFTHGRSLGKMTLGLRVVREDGGPIRFRHAFVRGLMSVPEIWLTFGAVALITSLASTQGKRLGDLLAGTVVIRERVPVQATTIAAMPPALAAWAQSLDLSRVPDDLALAARQFLGRSHELAPAVREDMGASMARAVAAVTAPPPPPGVPAWAFLSAVLAERRRRELARLAAPGPSYGGWSARPTSPAQPASSATPPPSPAAAPADPPGPERATQGPFAPPG